MSVEAMTWALGLSGLRGPVKHVLTVIAWHANPLFYLSKRQVARETGQDIKTVERAFVELETRGLIIKNGRRKGRTARVNEYFLDLSVDNLSTTLSTNTPKNGGIKGGGVVKSAPNTPKNGGGNTPKNGGQIINNKNIILTRAHVDPPAGVDKSVDPILKIKEVLQ